MQPPVGFLQSLQLFDPLLSIRWGSVIRQWVIERKAFVPTDEIFYLRRRRDRLERIMRGNKEVTQKQVSTLQGVSEEFIAANSGKRVILFAKVLDRRLFDELALSDVQGYGGYSRYADDLEAQEEREEKEKDRVAKNERMAFHGEVFDQLNFIWRKNETALLNGERNWQKLLK